MPHLFRGALPACLVGLALVTPSAAQDPTDESTSAEIRVALAADDLERAHELLTRLVVERRLERVAIERDAGREEAAWNLLKSVLRLAPTEARALALRGELAGVLLADQLASARAMLAEGNPRDAMVLLDLALELGPRDPVVAFLRGECSLRMGLEDGDVFAFSDARESFLAAARSDRAPAAWAGAGRAQFQLYGATQDPSDLLRALEHARRAAEETPEGDELAALLSFPVRRNHAEIANFAYVASKRSGEPGGTVKLRFEEARRAFEACVGDAPEDSWAWLRLADLFQWEQRIDEERALLARARAISPANQDLLARLGDAARRAGGVTESMAAYREVVAAEPGLAIGYWFLAGEELDLALELLDKGERFVDADIRAAEATYARCRELQVDYEGACRWKEARCRLALGRAAYLRGELDAARDAFLSMEDAVEGGLQESYPGRLHTGFDSLRMVVGAYMEAAGDERSSPAQRIETWGKAVALSGRLFAARPDDANLANDAGFVNRDAGEAYEREAKALLLPFVDSSRAVPDALRSEVAELLGRANAAMEESYRAYAIASELSPDDARVANDTGLILAYYLQREADVARAHFQRAITVGQAALEVGIEDEVQREDVVESVGDAHQGLGVIALVLEGDAAQALPSFRRSLEIGPYPRPEVSRSYLPTCTAIAAGAVDPELARAANAWGARDADALLAKLRAERALHAILLARG